MPPSSPEDHYSLEDYEELLSALAEAGFLFVVIGGCAIGVYARQRGELCFSADIDLYAQPSTIREIGEWLRVRGISLNHTPEPRQIPVTIFHWKGMRVDLFYAATGLPEPAQCLQSARVVRLKTSRHLEIFVADPFDLLRGKLQSNRKKDQPHIKVLREFVEAEVIDAFMSEVEPRDRIRPANRLLSALNSDVLPSHVFRGMLPNAKTPTDFRFLVHHAPSKTSTESALRAAHKSAVPHDVDKELNLIARSRRYPKVR